MTTQVATQPPMTVTSSAFTNNGEIPAVHTCDGEDRPFPLSIGAVPPGAKSLAVIVHDPDAPDPKAPSVTGWTHWVVYNLPPTTTSVTGELPRGALAGKQDWKQTAYRGPCPKIGKHRYVTTVYALDESLPDLAQPTRPQLLAAMKGHVIAKGELVGVYARQKK